jgi:hypothetical protein
MKILTNTERLSGAPCVLITIVTSWLLKLSLLTAILSITFVVIMVCVVYRTNIYLPIISSLCLNLIIWYGYLLLTVTTIPAIAIIYTFIMMKVMSWWYVHVVSILLLLVVSICGFYISVTLYNLLKVDKGLHRSTCWRLRI